MPFCVYGTIKLSVLRRIICQWVIEEEAWGNKLIRRKLRHPQLHTPCNVLTGNDSSVSGPRCFPRLSLHSYLIYHPHILVHQHNWGWDYHGFSSEALFQNICTLADNYHCLSPYFLRCHLALLMGWWQKKVLSSRREIPCTTFYNYGSNYVCQQYLEFK